MTTSVTSEISRLSLAEQIQLVEDIWDLIAANPGQLPLTVEQREELDHRLDAHKQVPETSSNWEDVKARLLPPI